MLGRLFTLLKPDIISVNIYALSNLLPQHLHISKAQETFKDAVLNSTTMTLQESR